MASKSKLEAQDSLPIAVEVPLVGRTKERAILSRALAEAKEGRGSAWLVEGPAGMGKTSLVRWVQASAEKDGFRALWGYALREVNTPFFPFQQIFRPTAFAVPRQEPLPALLPSYVVFEEEHPGRLLEHAAGLSGAHPALLVVRERPDSLRRRLPSLAGTAQVLWLSKAEGEDRVAPGDVDALGHRARLHLEATRGSVVILGGLDYLVSQNGFPSTLRLVQFLRDSAEEAQGHLLISFNPKAFGKREVALLEGEGQVVRAASPVAAAHPPGPESPVMTMIRYLDVLEREAPQQPVLLVVDDLQWADPDSLRTFQFLARNIRKLPVQLVATLRREEERTTADRQESVLTEVLEGMEREGTLHRLSLAGLSAEEATALSMELFSLPLAGESHDEALLEILRRAEGNPFFVMETLRQLAVEGYARKEGDRVRLVLSEEDPRSVGRPLLPETLRRLVVHRLERLSREEREVLEWAAVAGSEFDVSALGATMHREEGSLRGVLTRLAQGERLLEHLETRTGGERWAFAHPLVFEVLTSEMSPSELQRRSREMAVWWSERRPDDVETVARLYHEAREAGEGLPWVRSALERATQAHAMETVERYHRWLQELLEASGAGADGRVREGLGVAMRLMETSGSTREAAAILRSLRSATASRKTRWEVGACLLLALSYDNLSGAKQQLHRLEEEAQEAEGEDAPPRFMVDLSKALLAGREGRDAEMDAEATRVVDRGEAVPAWLRVLALTCSGRARAHEGDVVRAHERLAEAYALALPTGNARLMGLCSTLKGFIAESQGQVADARRACESTLELHRASGNPYSIGVTLGNLADCLALEGDLEGAQRAVVEHRKHVERFRLERQVHHVALREGVIKLHEGKWSQAAGELQEVVDTMVRSGELELVSAARLPLAEAQLGCGELSAARAEAEHVRKDDSELASYLRPILLMVEGRCLASEGKPSQAREAFQEAGRVAQTSRHTFNQALAKGHLARWEEAFGDPGRTRTFRQEATALFDRSGVLSNGWAREWPPRFRALPAEGQG